MPDVEIKDNFLPRTEWRAIHDLLLGNEFPWYFHPQKVSADTSVTDLDDYQLAHVFYLDNTLRSTYIDALRPLLSALGPIALVRIKANLTPRTHTIHTYGMHNDVDYAGVRTAVYYINDNDGATIFEHGDRVPTLANRFVSFPAHLLHAGTSCTTAKVRCVVNLNYVPLSRR